MPFETYKLGVKRLDTTPVGAGGVVLNDNFTALVDLAETAQAYPFVNVVDYGAVGDGSTDDSAAFQSAIDALELTGGTLWLPPNLSYVVKDITINSLYPVWIRSEMCNHILAGGGTTTWAGRGAVRPAAGAAHVFKWELHAGIGFAGFGAGGGIVGVNIADITTGAATFRTVEMTTAAIWVDDALAFTIEKCELQFIVGTAIRVDESTYCKIKEVKTYFCGDDSPSRPVIDCGGQATVAFLWIEMLFSENHYNTHIRTQLGGAIYWDGGHCENSGGVSAVTFVDGTAGGGHLLNIAFNNTTGSSVIFGGDTSLVTGSSITNCRFQNFPAANSTIKILANSHYTKLTNLQIAAAGQTGPVIEIDATDCVLDNIYTLAGGPIQIDGTGCRLSNIYRRIPGGTSSEYAIALNGQGCVLDGAFIRGGGTSVCNGVYVNIGKVSNVFIDGMDDGDAFETVGTLSKLCDCTIGDIGAGTPFIIADPGIFHSGLSGYGAAASDDNSDDIISWHTPTGILTTKDLTTAADATYTLQWSSDFINVNSRIFISVRRGTATQGEPVVINYLINADNVQITIKNIGADAINGTLIFDVQVVN
jgi:hypothetical protein